MTGSTGSMSSSSSPSSAIMPSSLPSPAHRSRPTSHPNKQREEDNKDQKISSILRAPCSVAVVMVLSLFSYADSLVVVGISVCTAFLYEGISWLLIYHTSTYKSLHSSIDKTSKKLKSLKSTSSTGGTVEGPASSSKKPSSRAKKMDRVETSLKESTCDLSLSKFKSGAIVAAVLFIIFCPLSPLSCSHGDPHLHLARRLHPRRLPSLSPPPL